MINYYLIFIDLYGNFKRKSTQSVGFTRGGVPDTAQYWWDVLTNHLNHRSIIKFRKLYFFLRTDICITNFLPNYKCMYIFLSTLIIFN